MKPNTQEEHITTPIENTTENAGGNTEQEAILEDLATFFKEQKGVSLYNSPQAFGRKEHARDLMNQLSTFVEEGDFSQEKYEQYAHDLAIAFAPLRECFNFHHTMHAQMGRVIALLNEQVSSNFGDLTSDFDTANYVLSQKYLANVEWRHLFDSPEIQAQLMTLKEMIEQYRTYERKLAVAAHECDVVITRLNNEVDSLFVQQQKGILENLGYSSDNNPVFGDNKRVPINKAASKEISKSKDKTV